MLVSSTYSMRLACGAGVDELLVVQTILLLDTVLLDLRPSLAIVLMRKTEALKRLSRYLSSQEAVDSYCTHIAESSRFDFVHS